MRFRASMPVDRGRPWVLNWSSSRRTQMTAAFCRRARTFSPRSTAPPPVARTQPLSLPYSFTISLSMSRKAASPRFLKISGIGPKRFTISSSRSIKRLPSLSAAARPKVDLPLPGMPTNTRFRHSRRTLLYASAIFSSGISSFKNSLAACQAWAISIQSPSIWGMPASSASNKSAVFAGL